MNNPPPGPLLGKACPPGYTEIVGRCVFYHPTSGMIQPGAVAPPMAEPPSRASLTYPIGPSDLSGRGPRRTR